MIDSALTAALRDSHPRVACVGTYICSVLPWISREDSQEKNQNVLFFQRHRHNNQLPLKCLQFTYRFES